MNLQPVLEYLQLKGYGQRGRDLFRDHLPDQVSKGILITVLMPHLIHPYIYKKVTGDFQMIVRGVDADEARARASLAMETLRVQGKDMGNIHFFYIRPKHLPIVFPASDGQYIEASVNFECAYIINPE